LFRRLWGTHEVVDWVMISDIKIFGKYEKTFRLKCIESSVCGEDLEEISGTELCDLGISKLKDRRHLIKLIQKLIDEKPKNTIEFEGQNFKIN